MQLNTKMQSIVYLVLTILFWSATPAVAKIALAELDNLQLLMYSSIVGVVSLYIVVLFQGKQQELRKLRGSDFLKMLSMGFVGIFLYYVFLFGSFAIAPAGQANIVNYLWPIFIVIFSIPILRESFNHKTIAAVIISFVGALVVFTGGKITSFDSEYTLGYLLAALAAVCYGLFSVFGKKLHYEKFSSMFVYYVFATILIIPTVLMFSDVVIPQQLGTIVAILLMGGVFNSITFVFWFKALQYGHTHKTANAVYVVPFLALVWTYLFNSEPVSIVAILGLSLIILGIGIQQKNHT